MPFEMPWKFLNTSSILPPSIQSRNWIHDAGDSTTAALDHDGIGKCSPANTACRVRLAKLITPHR